MTWFELDLAEGHLASTHPSQCQKNWSQAIHWIQPIPVAPGDELTIIAARSDTTTMFEIQVHSQVHGARRDYRLPIAVVAPGKLAEMKFGKVSSRTWEILSSPKVVSACADSIEHAIRAKQYVNLKHPRPGGIHVLELQCGPTFGLFSIMAKKAGAREVLTCDTNPTFIEISSALAEFNSLSIDSASLHFTTTHPSKITCGGDSDAEGHLTRPVDFLLLPIPEYGLFEGGLLKLVRAVQQNRGILAADAMIFPSKMHIFAQVIEIDHMIDLGGPLGVLDCTSSHCLVIPSSFAAQQTVDLDACSHRKLSPAVKMASVDLVKIMADSSVDPSSCLDASIGNIKVTASGRASAIVWWWVLDLYYLDKPTLKLSSAPSSGYSPWPQVSPTSNYLYSHNHDV
jgi:hypothetical protein